MMIHQKMHSIFIWVRWESA